MSAYWSIVLGLSWLAVGIVLFFDIGRFPTRLIRGLHSKRGELEEAAIVPGYWRFWGSVLGVAGIVLIAYTLSR